MGLTLTVGIIPALAADEPDLAARYKGDFTRVNEALHHAGLPVHHEPDQPAPTTPAVPWEFEMHDYSTLHCLRRLAAYLGLRDELPVAGDDSAAADDINEKWCIWATNHQPTGILPRILGDRVEAPIDYEHLIVHSDSEGFYVPIKFHRVVIAPEHIGVVGGGLIGSSHSLREDCERIARRIGLPLDLDPESDEVSDAVDRQGKIDKGWQRYGVESFACLALHRAATLSIESGCALVFC